MDTLFHVLNRGIDKRTIFLDDQDHFRFIHDLYEFNDENGVESTSYSFAKTFSAQIADLRGREIREKRKRKLLVRIYAFCLMPNHYHLLVSPVVDTGIARFMQKLNAGYAKYFNEKYKRKGTIFEGRYKSIAVNREAHFIHLPYYIHLNPLDLTAPEWRNKTLNNYHQAMTFLEHYRWSSFLDYIGKKNFPSIIDMELLSEMFSSPREYKKQTSQWLKDMEINSIQDVLLE